MTYDNSHTMTVIYITGTGSGIGKALAEQCLATGWKVIGYSRTNHIQHPDFTFVPLALSHPEQYENLHFDILPDATRIVLVNNAGTLGEVKYAGRLDDRQLIQTVQVNLTAVMLLTNRFLRAYGNHPAVTTIINISSGAAQNPIDGWSTYCACKAAVDMYSRTVDLELRKHTASSRCRVFSIAPGIVDTPMQAAIRQISEAEFSRVEEFRAFLREGKLASPAQVADKLVQVINHPDSYQEVVFRL